MDTEPRVGGNRITSVVTIPRNHATNHTQRLSPFTRATYVRFFSNRAVRHNCKTIAGVNIITKPICGYDCVVELELVPILLQLGVIFEAVANQ